MDAVLVGFAALPFLGGVAMLVVAARLRRKEAALRETGTGTTGTVVDNQTQSLANGRLVFRPVLEFSTSTRKKVRAVGGMTSSRSFVTGTQLPLVYDPSDPSRIISGSSDSSRYLVGGVILSVFGIGALLLSLWALSVIAGSA